MEREAMWILVCVAVVGIGVVAYVAYSRWFRKSQILCVWCDQPIGWKPWPGVTDNCICTTCFGERLGELNLYKRGDLVVSKGGFYGIFLRYLELGVEVLFGDGIGRQVLQDSEISAVSANGVTMITERTDFLTGLEVSRP